MHAVLVGKQAYYWSYMAPMARAYHARFGERAPVILIDGAQLQDPEYAMSVTWRKVRHCRLVFSFDMWALLHARLHGKSVNHIHHSLVGKGSAFKGERAFPPFYLAERNHALAVMAIFRSTGMGLLHCRYNFRRLCKVGANNMV
jgi:hypothetical protein